MASKERQANNQVASPDTPSDVPTIPLNLAIQIFAYSAFPLVIVAICAVLLYSRVDESVQSVMKASAETPLLLVNASGSTFFSTTCWRWMGLFKQSLNVAQYQINLEYLSTGSQRGQQDFFDGYSLFAATEHDIESNKSSFFIDPSNNSSGINPSAPEHYGLLMFPVIAGALAIVHNTPNLSTPNSSLILTANLLSEIFNNQIQWWNDTRLQKANPAAHFPNERIAVIVLSDPADIFPVYLRKYNASAFNTTTAGHVWPSSFITTTNIFEAMYISGTTVNSITYTTVEAVREAEASGQSPTCAYIVNSAGTAMAPTTDAIAAAMNASLKTVMPTKLITAHNYLSIIDSNATNAYPLSVMSFVIIQQNYYYFSAPPPQSNYCMRINYLVQFLYFSLTDSSTDVGLEEKGWVAINDALLNQNLEALATITCGGVNVMNLVLQSFQETAFYAVVGENSYTSILFWSNLDSFPVTVIGMSLYLAFYDAELEKKDRHSEVGKVKWTLQNWLGIVTQCCMCFQIVYLCLNRSSVILDDVYVSVVSYLGLIFDWFWYYVIINILVFVWLACIYYTTFLYGFIEYYYPHRLNSLTKFHAFLSNFMPNFALIFYNPSVELLAKVFDCKLSTETYTYTNTYAQTCWTRGHWVSTVLSITLGCAYTNSVVRYCKILKLLRKDFHFKDADWSIYLDSISKTTIIILFFNTPNVVFLASAGAVMACLGGCAVVGRPNLVPWYDRIRGCLYAYAMVQFKAGVSEAEKKKQEAELKKFFAAFGEEIQSISAGPVDIDFLIDTSNPGFTNDVGQLDRNVDIGSEMNHSSSRLTSSLLHGVTAAVSEHLRPALLLPPSVPLHLHVGGDSALSLNAAFSGKWQKLDELMVKAGNVGLLNDDELDAVRVAISFEDPMIPILFNRSNKDFSRFTELIKVRVWQALLDESSPHAPSSTNAVHITATDVPAANFRPVIVQPRPMSFAQSRPASSIQSRPVSIAPSTKGSQFSAVASIISRSVPPNEDANVGNIGGNTEDGSNNGGRQSRRLSLLPKVMSGPLLRRNSAITGAITANPKITAREMTGARPRPFSLIDGSNTGGNSKIKKLGAMNFESTIGGALSRNVLKTAVAGPKINFGGANEGDGGVLNAGNPPSAHFMSRLEEISIESLGKPNGCNGNGGLRPVSQGYSEYVTQNLKPQKSLDPTARSSVAVKSPDIKVGDVVIVEGTEYQTMGVQDSKYETTENDFANNAFNIKAHHPVNTAKIVQESVEEQLIKHIRPPAKPHPERKEVRTRRYSRDPSSV
ncbi:hypothetical protein HK100_012878 [Physocladia obscura]|uniref:PBP domain-containing protein n=1 Tax=Physocladia obscura TaxID=109957 RepID=A0AAD5XKG5_9FUNG|nr:hypothetical protein HK100_012878 [Physocladia obscura]